jgi:two-component system, LytTR family, sensor kinase
MRFVSKLKEMKKILILLLSTISFVQMIGQINLKHYSTSFGENLGMNNNKPDIIVATLNTGYYRNIYEFVDNDALIRFDSLENLFTDFNNFSIFENPIDTNILTEVNPHDTTFVFTVDSSEAHFFVGGVYRRNAKEYEFRVKEDNDKIIMPWSSITQFSADSVQISNYEKGIAYLGAYKTTLDHYIIVEIRKKGSVIPLQKIGVYWQKTKPRLLNIYTANELNDFLKKLKKTISYLNKEERAKWAALYLPNEIDVKSSLPKKLILDAREDNVVFFLDVNILEKNALEYKVIKDGDVLFDWQANDFDNNFVWLKNLKHGEYKLQMRYAIQRHNITEYPFKIKPEWYQTGRFQAVLGGLTFIFLGFFVLLYFFIKQKIKRKQDIKEREKIENELKSIRSQLNPHFVFNALSSIQGLMNKNELTQANYYLTEFSTLLRESLLSNEKEFVPFNTELKTLETYIKLEQLRFPFQYTILIDENLDKNAIELPYLLLQPLVENAIKHGVSNLYEKGKIDMRIYPKNKELFVEIKDNGKGFNTEGVTGFGLKLTKERVNLLTDSNPYQTVSLMINSNETDGTTALLGFKNWL